MQRLFPPKCGCKCPPVVFFFLERGKPFNYDGEVGSLVKPRYGNGKGAAQQREVTLCKRLNTKYVSSLEEKLFRSDT
jgi:hypothetical protein